MMYRNSARLLFTALVVGAAACADSTAPAAGVTEAILTRDVANDAADVTVRDLSYMGGVEVLVGMPLTSSPMSSSSGLGSCTWNNGGRLYDCPDITTPDGLTLSRKLGFYSGGIIVPSYDALTTDSLFFGAWLSGTVSETGRTAWLKHGRLFMVTGLTGAETARTWRGEGSRDDSAHVTTDNVARTIHIMAEDVTNNVVFKLPRADFPFPQSGTITHDVTVSETTPNGTEASNRSGTRHVVVAFNGTRTASVTVGSTACTLDLVTRKLSCP